MDLINMLSWIIGIVIIALFEGFLYKTNRAGKPVDRKGKYISYKSGFIRWIGELLIVAFFIQPLIEESIRAVFSILGNFSILLFFMLVLVIYYLYKYSI